MPELEVDIHRDEIEIDPFEAQALRRSSRERDMNFSSVNKMTFCS